MNVEEMNVELRLRHAALAAKKIGGAHQVNPWNIPTDDNDLPEEILAVLSQPVDRAHDAIREGHEIESEYYDDWCATLETDEEELANMAYHKPHVGAGPIFNVHRESCWKDGQEYDATGAPIGDAFDVEKYQRKLRKLDKACRVNACPAITDNAGRIRKRPVQAIIAQYKSERSDVWLEPSSQPADYLDDLTF